MANNNKRTMTLNLKVDLDSKDAERDIKKLSNDINSIISDMNRSGSSMTFFKELVSYISKIDSEMNAFRTKHADDFDRIFSGLDTGLQSQMQKLFGTTKDQLIQIAALRDKISAAKNNKDITKDEVRAIRDEVKALYSAMDMGDQFKISGNFGIEKMLQKSEEALDSFVLKWRDVNSQVSKGFDFNAGGIGSGNNIDNDLEEFNKNIQEEVNKLQNEIDELENAKKQYEKVIKDLKKVNTTKDLVSKSKYTPDTSIEGVQKLMDEFTELQQKVQSGNKDSIEYYQNLSKLAEVAIKLNNSQKTILSDDSLKKQFQDTTTKDKRYDNKYTELLNYTGSRTDAIINRANNSNGVKNIENFIKAKQEEIKIIEVSGARQVSVYDNLIQKLQEYIQVSQRIDNEKDLDDDTLDSLSDEAEELELTISELSKAGDKAEEVVNILNKMRLSKFTEDEALLKLCDTLGIEIPKNAEKAKSAINDLNNGKAKTNNIINIDSLKSDFEKIHDLAFQTKNELSFSITSDGIKYAIESLEGVTKISDEAATAVRSLNDGLTVLAHSHPDGNGYFSIQDLYSGLNVKMTGVNSPIMALGKNMASVLNLDGVTDDVINKVRKKLDTLPKDAMISPKIFTELQNIFKDNGFKNVLQKFNISDGADSLVNFLKQITTNAQEAQTPLEKLQSLISYYSDGKINSGNMSTFSSYWDEFEQGAKSAVEVFDAVMAKINARDAEGNLIQIGTAENQALPFASKNIMVGNNSTNIQKEAAAHRDNTDAIQEEMVAKSNLNNIDYDDAAADIARENGQLEEKLELLREIADQYGVNITNANRDRYEELNQKDMNDGLTSREEDRFSELGDKIEEADANLEEFGATYDKITLKFANGKTKDIFPDDKGLRDLYKYADSPAYDEFNGKEIEDVIFTRKQEQEIIEQTNQDLQEQVRIQERVNEVSDNKPNKDVVAEIEEQNEALQRQKTLYEYIEKTNKEKRKVSGTTLGVTDAEDPTFFSIEKQSFVEEKILNIVKEKQNALKNYLNELVQIENQEKTNGQLTEDEISRRKELVSLIKKMQLSVRYKDGTYYSTSDFDSLYLSESINKLNEIINLRKKIELGYYGTGTYGTIADTYNGINISDLLDEGSRSFDFDIQEFDQSAVGRLIREYQDLHEEMLRCLLVGEEVPQTTLDRLKWFESLDSSKLDEIIPKLTELRNKINEFDDYETGIDKKTKTLQDESYYDEKILKLQEFLDVKQKYLELGGPPEEFGDHWSIDDIEESINRTIELRDNLKEVQRLKNEFSEIHSDVDLENDEEYINILRRLQIGNDNYSNSLKSMNAVYEKRNKDAINAANVLRQEASAQEELNNSQKEVRNYIDNTAEEARENAEATEKEAASHRENADAIREEERVQDELNQKRKETKDADTSEEIAQLERLKSILNEVTAAVEAKTQAFRDEGSVVDEVVSKETIALDTLSTYLDTIYVVINNIIDGLNKINNTKLNDVQDKESQVVTDRDNTTNSNIQDITNKYALDSTLSTTNSILQSILTAVNSGEATNQVAEALDGAVADLKAAADALKTNVDNVKQKVKDDAKDKIKDTSTDLKKEKTFDDIKNTEVGNFEQYKKDVENSIYVTDEFKDRLSKLGSQLNNIGDAKGLDAWKQSVSEFKDEFSRYEDANKKVLTGQINTIKKEAKDAMKGLDLDIPTNDLEKRAKQEEIAQGFKEIQIASDICTNKIKNNQDIEINALNATKMQLLENINAYKKEYGLLNSGGKNGKNYGNTAVIRETTRYNQFQQYANDAEMGFKDSSTFNNKLQEYINAYNKLIAKREELATKTVLTDRDVQEFNDAKQAAAGYAKELDKMIAKSNKLNATQYQSSAVGSDINVEDALSRKQALTDFVTGMHDASESTIKFSNDYQECTFKMKNSEGTFTKMTAILDKTSNKMYSAAGEVTKYKTAFGEFIGSLKGEFLKLGRYMIASFGIEEVMQAVRTGVTYVREIDNALTELKKVTNETDAGYERFLQTMSKTAGVVGSTVAELTTMAAEWSRLGYSIKEAADLAESTAVLLNVSEFEDATTASEALISTIQAFGYAADDSMHVVDILNEVGFYKPRLYSNI